MKKTFWFPSQGKKLYGVFEKPENSNSHLIILLHGLTNSMVDCPLINEASEALLKAGFPIFKFDYFGSGKSEGMFIDKTFKILYQNTVDALDYAKNKLKFKKIGLWGRSLGAIMASIVCDDPHIFSSVIISSATHTNTTFSYVFKKDEAFSMPMKGTGAIKGKPILRHKFYEETNWIDKLQEKHLSKSKNIIVIQGTEDKTIKDMNYAKEIYGFINGKKKLEYIKGANHAFSGLENKVVNMGVDWLASFVKYGKTKSS